MFYFHYVENISAVLHSLVLFQAIQFSISIRFSSISTYQVLQLQTRVDLGSDSNEGVLCIPQSSSITGTSPSDCLVSYPGHLLRGVSYPSAEKQFVYSTAPPPQLTGQHSIVANVLNCAIIVSKFELGCAITFTLSLISLRKVWTSLFPPHYRLYSSTIVLWEWLLH